MKGKEGQTYEALTNLRRWLPGSGASSTTLRRNSSTSSSSSSAVGINAFELFFPLLCFCIIGWQISRGGEATDVLVVRKPNIFCRSLLKTVAFLSRAFCVLQRKEKSLKSIYKILKTTKTFFSFLSTINVSFMFRNARSIVEFRRRLAGSSFSRGEIVLHCLS